MNYKMYKIKSLYDNKMDALQQSSDMVFALSRPWVLDIPTYGPKNYEVYKSDVFVHILKTRNGNQNESILFMRMDGSIQKFFEIPEPIQVQQTNNFQRKYGKANP